MARKGHIQSPAMATEIKLAGGGRRLIAYLIDVLILTVLNGVWVSVFFTKRWGGGYDTGHMTVLAVVLYVAYCWLFLGLQGQTPGKKAMGIMVIRTDFENIGMGRAAWRVVSGLVLSFATFGVGGLIDVAWLLWDRDNQTLHDKVARTWVVDAYYRGKRKNAADPYESANPGLGL